MREREAIESMLSEVGAVDPPLQFHRISRSASPRPYPLTAGALDKSFAEIDRAWIGDLCRSVTGCGQIIHARNALPRRVGHVELALQPISRSLRRVESDHDIRAVARYADEAERDAKFKRPNIRAVPAGGRDGAENNPRY